MTLDGMIHFSESPLPAPLRHTEQKPSPGWGGWGPKPRGLWYGIGPSWKDWLKVEMPHWLASVNHVYRFRLHEPPVRPLLRLTSVREILAFDREYGHVEDGAPSFLRYPHWGRVAEHYGGIEIAPYQWSLRHDVGVSWYYPWDVASGCIWDPRLIARWEELPLELAREPGNQSQPGDVPAEQAPTADAGSAA